MVSHAKGPTHKKFHQKRGRKAHFEGDTGYDLRDRRRGFVSKAVQATRRNFRLGTRGPLPGKKRFTRLELSQSQGPMVLALRQLPVV